jgi:hypothetical protein
MSNMSKRTYDIIDNELDTRIDNLKESSVANLVKQDEEYLAEGGVDLEVYNDFKKTFTRFYTHRSWRDLDGDGDLEPRGDYNKVTWTARGTKESLPHNFDEGQTETYLDSVPQRLGSSAGEKLAGHILVNPDLSESDKSGLFLEVATPKKYVDETKVSKRPMSGEDYYKYTALYESRPTGAYDDNGNAITETKLRYVVDDYQNTHMTKVKQSHVPMRNVDGRVLVRKDPYAEGGSAADEREAASRWFVENTISEACTGKVSRLDSSTSSRVYIEQNDAAGLIGIDAKYGAMYTFDDKCVNDVTSAALNQLTFDSGLYVKSNGTGNLSHQLASIKEDTVHGKYLNIYSDKRATAAAGTTERSHSVFLPDAKILCDNPNVSILEMDMKAAGTTGDPTNDYKHFEAQLQFAGPKDKQSTFGRVMEGVSLCDTGNWIKLRLEAYLNEHVIQVYVDNKYVDTITTCNNKAVAFTADNFGDCRTATINSYNASGSVDLSFDNISFYQTVKEFKAIPNNIYDADGMEIPLRRVDDGTIHCETPLDAEGTTVANVNFVKDQISKVSGAEVTKAYVDSQIETINNKLNSVGKPDVDKAYVDSQIGDIQAVLEAINAQISTFEGV